MIIKGLENASALFLDIDGTLLEFAPSPDQVVVPAELPGLLHRLSDALGGALALISGREIAVIDRMFDPLRLPAAGQHGAEWRIETDGRLMSLPPPAGYATMLRSLRQLAARRTDVFLEPKPFSVAVHYHGGGEGLCDQIGALIEMAGDESWLLLSARQAFEVKHPGYDKGVAIRRFLEHAPFRGRCPMFLGDDLTDEDGFSAVLAAGGSVVRVGPDERPSLATARLQSPAVTREWLSHQLSLLRPGAASPGSLEFKGCD